MRSLQFPFGEYSQQERFLDLCVHMSVGVHACMCAAHGPVTERLIIVNDKVLVNIKK